MTLPPRSVRDKEFLLHLRERLRSRKPVKACFPFCMQTPHSKSAVQNPNNRPHPFGFRVKFVVM
jgi:hypothetical protein